MTAHDDGEGRGAIVAVIDVGSNSVRLLVARQVTPSAFEVVDEAKFDARLGEGQGSGALSPAGIERGRSAMRVMAQVARSFEPSSIVVAGTEALRRAPNSPEFVAAVEADTGLRIRILSGHEEAHASFLGTVNSTTLTDGAIVDIGGGSLEVMRVKNRQLVAVESVSLGAIYATERYFKSDPPSRREVRALRKAVDDAISVAKGVPVLFGVGGAVRNLARIVRQKRSYPLRRLHGFEIRRRELERTVTALSTVPAEARRKIPGVTLSRVDTLPAAAIVLHQVLTHTEAETLTVAGQGLREGLVWSELRPGQPIVADVREASVIGLARANGIEQELSDCVVAATKMLFAATESLHALQATDLDLVRHAARLSGIGLHIDYYNRDRHAEYLVHSGDLHGFSHREITILAALVRWSWEGTPDLSPYKDIMLPDDTRRATILAALLGVARAVYRRHPTPVKGFSVVADGKHLTLRLSADGPLDAELHELDPRCRRLESVVKIQVSIEVEPAP